MILIDMYQNIYNLLEWLFFNFFCLFVLNFYFILKIMSNLKNHFFQIYAEDFLAAATNSKSGAKELKETAVREELKELYHKVS